MIQCSSINSIRVEKLKEDQNCIILLGGMSFFEILYNIISLPKGTNVQQCIAKIGARRCDFDYSSLSASVLGLTLSKKLFQ